MGKGEMRDGKRENGEVQNWRVRRRMEDRNVEKGLGTEGR